MVATVFVTQPAEAEFAALVGRTFTAEQLRMLQQHRNYIVRTLSNLEAAFTWGEEMGRGKGTPQAIIRRGGKGFLWAYIYIFVAERCIFISHFETRPTRWPEVQWSDAFF